MLFAIVNPHGPYQIEAGSLAAAMGAIAILGEGKYGLLPIGHDAPSVRPVFGGDWGASLYAAAGIEPASATGLGNWMNVPANNEAVAAALDTVRLGPDIPGRPTSTFDLAACARQYAEALRGRRMFAPVDAAAGNPRAEDLR